MITSKKGETGIECCCFIVKRAISICFALMLFNIHHVQASEPRVQNNSASHSLSEAFIKACGQYDTLSKIKGHFEGGNWNDAVDKWGGAKHMALQAIMTEMERLATLSSADTIINACTKNVHHKTNADKHYANVVRATEWFWGRQQVTHPSTDPFAIQVYPWRGERDFMVVAVQNNKIIAAGWALAGE